MRAERTFERKVEHRIACEDGNGIAQPVERLPGQPAVPNGDVSRK